MQKTKTEIRKFIKQEIQKNSASLNENSSNICFQIIKSELFKNADVVFSYMPLADEVDVHPLVNEIFAQKKKLALPKINDDGLTMDFFLFEDEINLSQSLKSGFYGIQEPFSNAEPVNPLEINQNVLILVPGRAFSHDGKRLGRGKGFYDSYLCPLVDKKNFTFAGVCFPFQILEDIPVDSNDVNLHYVFSGL